MTDLAPTPPGAAAPAAPPPHRSRRERRHAGKVLRRSVPRSVHGEWAPEPDRPDPVTLLEEDARSRVAELLPIRNGRMAASLSGFLRGAGVVMAWDLSRTPVTGVSAQICGDAHLANFGMLAGSGGRRCFDLTEFDETVRGPWEWDVKRLAASAVVAGREAGLPEEGCRDAVLEFSGSYRHHFRRLSELTTLDVWFDEVDADSARKALDRAQGKKAAPPADGAFARARAHADEDVTAGLTAEVDGERRLVDRPPLVEHVPGDDADGHVERLWAGARSSYPDELQHLADRFRFVDATRAVLGVAGVGTRSWVALLAGGADDDPLVLRVTEARESVLAPHLPTSPHETQGERIVHGQRLLQAAPDPFLGWTLDRADGSAYCVRQMQALERIDLGRLAGPGLAGYLSVCAWALARAHARSGDVAVISGYLGTGDAFDRALARFARAYADQVEADHAALVTAVRTGRLPAEDA